LQTPRPPLVTIGITTWNRRPLLQLAVESALAQTYPHLQIVISDDASTDETSAYLENLTDPRLLIQRNPVNLGMVANFNRCLDAANGEFVLMLNDDDVLLPTAIEKLVHAFLHPPGNLPPDSIGLAWCPFTNVDSSGLALWTVRGGPAVERSVDFLAGHFNGTRGPICSSILLRTADARAEGGYDLRYGDLSDSALAGKVALRYPSTACVDEPLMRYYMQRTTTHCSTGRGSCIAWQSSIRLQVQDYVAILRNRGDDHDARRLLRAAAHTLANTTATILIRSLGSPGSIALMARECWRSRRFMLTPFVAKRILIDGWKLIQILRHARRELRQISSHALHPSTQPNKPHAMSDLSPPSMF
jgi:glycosyltransferase involved in cell wall biosynthesis